MAAKKQIVPLLVGLFLFPFCSIVWASLWDSAAHIQGTSSQPELGICGNTLTDTHKCFQSHQVDRVNCHSLTVCCCLCHLIVRNVLESAFGPHFKGLIVCSWSLMKGTWALKPGRLNILPFVPFYSSEILGKPLTFPVPMSLPVICRWYQ